MDFNERLYEIVASVIIVWRRFILLIFYPYKTVRKISQEKDGVQLIIILVIVFLVFLLSSFVRPKENNFFISFATFISMFGATVFFIHIVAYMMKGRSSVQSLFFTSAYSLLPSLLWFSATSILFLLVPPPRTPSSLGIMFSFIYIVFSISLLSWRILLFYLSIRFSTKLDVTRSILLICIYVLVLSAVSLLLYQWGIRRIPFI